MSTISTIATSQQSLAMRQIIAEKTGQLGTLAKEAATGMKEDVFKGPPSLTAGALEMRSKMAENSSYTDSNKLLQGKMDTIEDLLASFQKDATDFQGLTIGGTISDSNRDIYRRQAETMLTKLADTLNVTYRGEFLFSGLDTNTKPMEVDASGEVVSYMGGTGPDMTARIDSQTVVEYGLRGDNPAFTEIFDAIETVLSTNLDALTPGDFSTFMGDIGTSLSEGLTGLLSMQTGLGNQQRIVQDKIDAQMALDNIYNNSVVNIESVNMEETAMRLHAIQLQLETTYQITARMSGMSLMNYL